MFLWKTLAKVLLPQDRGDTGLWFKKCVQTDAKLVFDDFVRAYFSKSAPRDATGPYARLTNKHFIRC